MSCMEPLLAYPVLGGFAPPRTQMGAVAITLARVGHINPRARGWGSGPWRALWLIIAAREMTPTRLPPNKSEQVGGRRPRIKSGAGSPPLRGRYCGACCFHVRFIAPFSG